MIIKQNTEIELHFDNHGEYLDYQEMYKRKGYNVTPYGQVKSYNDWWFIADKED